VDCDPYSTLVGAQSSNADGCDHTANFTVGNQNEAWCADFAKWVWQQAGVTQDMNTITAQAGSFYDWGLRQKQALRPGRGTPAAGDAVVFYPPGPIGPGTLADHVGIVTAVHPGGTVDLVNGDFLGATNIGVQYDPASG
jgi:CHAP domain-containing protein